MNEIAIKVLVMGAIIIVPYSLLFAFKGVETNTHFDDSRDIYVTNGLAEINGTIEQLGITKVVGKVKQFF